MSTDMPGEVRSNDGLGLEQWMPLAEAKRLAALWTTGCDFDNASQWRAAMRVLLDENKRLGTELAKANDQAERFERGWYLRGDALERLRSWADAYPLEVFPEMLRQDWQRANEVLAQAGLNMSRMSVSNMRHVISGVRKLVDEGLKA